MGNFFLPGSGKPDVGLSPEEEMESGEADMREFVQKFEEVASQNGKPAQQLLYLKRIRLHHKVLSDVSFNAYKLLIESF